MTATSRSKREIVSFENEPLILVDSSDQELGVLDKSSCHDGDGRLHRAFSIFVLNGRGEVLLQKRADGKRLWPGFWSNSCCSHPRRGETTAEAADRRLFEELHQRAELQFAYKFEYHARYQAIGSEHELCWVFVGWCDDAPVFNSEEIEAVRWLQPDLLDEEMRRTPDAFTPWFQMEWQRLRQEFADLL